MGNFIIRPDLHPSARLRLFCFHAAGIGASQYIPWARLLPREIEICAIQLPGRESRLRELPYRHIDPLLSDLEEAIYPLLDLPFAIFGLSLGATVGFELALRLKQAYQVTPEHLFVASRRAPHIPDRLPPVAQLSDDLFIEAVQQRYHGIPDVILGDKELLDLFLPALRADFQILESYQFHRQAPLDCSLTAFRGLDDNIVEPADLNGWKEYTRKEFTHQAVEGGHFFFQGRHAMFVQTLAEKLIGPGSIIGHEPIDAV